MEIFFGRVTALKLNQKNEKGEIEARYFPQIERTVVNDGEPNPSEWILTSNADGQTIFFLSEKEALDFAMEIRDKENSNQ